MALDTYDALKTSVLSWLARPGDPLVEPAVPDMVRLFEAEANRRLRAVDAERVAALTVPANGYVLLPTDCWAIRQVTVDGLQLEYRPPGSGVFWQSGGGLRFYSLLGPGRAGESGLWTQFALVVGPVGGGTVELVYQVGVPPLGPTRPINWLLSRHCDAYLWGVLAEAELYIGHDERAPLWLQRRDAVFGSIDAYDRKARWAGPMQVRVHGITTSAAGGTPSADTPAVIVVEDAAVRVVNPISGGIVIMGAGERALYIEGGPRGSLSLTLPPDPVADMLVEISFANPVTALTVTGLAEPVSAYGPGAGLQFRYVDGSWVYWS